MDFQDELRDIMGLKNPDNFPELPDWYEKPSVTLVGTDGNAFSLMGKVKTVILRKGRDKSMRDEYNKQADLFLKHATSGDYDKLIRACEYWTEVD